MDIFVGDSLRTFLVSFQGKVLEVKILGQRSNSCKTLNTYGQRVEIELV